MPSRINNAIILLLLRTNERIQALSPIGQALLEVGLLLLMVVLALLTIHSGPIPHNYYRGPHPW